MDEENLKKQKLSWHRHPLLVAFVSFILAGVILNWIQTNANKTKTLREKRIAVMEDVARFSAYSSSAFRTINSYAKTIGKSDITTTKRLELQDKLQEAIETAYLAANKTELELLIYFPETRAYYDLAAARFSLQDKLKEALEKLKLLKSPETIFNTNEFNKQKNLINNILITLIKKIGFKGAEKHPAINKELSGDEEIE
jgi:hypothetical protein